MLLTEIHFYQTNLYVTSYITTKYLTRLKQANLDLSVMLFSHAFEIPGKLSSHKVHANRNHCLGNNTNVTNEIHTSAYYG